MDPHDLTSPPSDLSSPPSDGQLADQKVKVGETAMTPAEAQENQRQVEEEKRAREAAQAGPATVPPDANINQPPQPSNPQTVRSAEGLEKESGASKGARVATADPDNAGEKSRAWSGTGKAGMNEVFAMTNVDGEKLKITRKQWAKYGGQLMANGWTEPEFAKAEGIAAGGETIPNDIDWGTDPPC